MRLARGSATRMCSQSNRSSRHHSQDSEPPPCPPPRRGLVPWPRLHPRLFVACPPPRQNKLWQCSRQIMPARRARCPRRMRSTRHSPSRRQRSAPLVLQRQQERQKRLKLQPPCNPTARARKRGGERDVGERAQAGRHPMRFEFRVPAVCKTPLRRPAAIYCGAGGGDCPVLITCSFS